MAVKDIQSGQEFVRGYLVETGIDPRLMEPALMTPPDRIYIFVQDELSGYGLATAPNTA